MTARWKITSLLLAIVVASGLAGGFVGFEWAKSIVRKRSNPEAWNVSAMRTIDRRLKLTPQQKTAVQAHLDRGVVELKQLRIETMMQTAPVLDRMLAGMEKEMSPEQMPEFAKLKKERGMPTVDMLKVEPRQKPANP